MLMSANMQRLLDRAKLARQVEDMDGLQSYEREQFIPFGRVHAWPQDMMNRSTKTILQGGTLGNILPVRVNERVQLVTVAGPDADANVMAVTLIPPLQASLGVPDSVFLGHESGFAVVQWGVGGGVSMVEIDYGRGGSFSLVASSVRVFAVRETQGGAATAVSFGACISKMPIASPLAMTRTFRSISTNPAGIAPGGAINVQIPPFSKWVTCYSDDRGGLSHGSEPMRVTMFNFFSVRQCTVELATGQNPTRIPLVNQASFLNVENTSLQTVDMSFVFELAL